MKRLKRTHYTNKEALTMKDKADFQEDMIDLMGDHIHVFGCEGLFRETFGFLVKCLYDTAPNHKEAYRILYESINEGIEKHISNHKGAK